MARTKSLAALVAIGTALTASALQAKPPERHDASRGLDSLNQPVVQRSDYVMDLNAAGEGLSVVERGRLDAWFSSLGLGYGDRVYVEEGYGPGPALRDVAMVAADYGLLVSDGAPVMTGEVQPGTVRVIVSRSSAMVPNCPNYETSRGPSSTSSNYGCSVNSNWAAMVANPTDLVLGQAGSGTGDANTASKAIKVYRESPPTGVKGLDQTSTRGKN